MNFKDDEVKEARLLNEALEEVKEDHVLKSNEELLQFKKI